MSDITATEARKRLFQLLDEVADTHVPVRIAGKRNVAMLVSESDWRAIEETLFLCSIPGMRDSIIEGMATAVEECTEDIGW